MTPLRITAHLSRPPVMRNPIYLDAILLYGLGSSMGAAREDGLEDFAKVESQILPLAVVKTAAGWWYAASAVVPIGREVRRHLHRRPALDLLTRYTTAGRVEIGSGPDKSLRLPYFQRAQMRTLTWTCHGDRDRIAGLLCHVREIGALSKMHGHVEGWEIGADPVGPLLADYGRDLALRHLPAALTPDRPGDARVLRRALPLTPPYHQRGRSVECWQVTGWV